jgi:hypothetical protein
MADLAPEQLAGPGPRLAPFINHSVGHRSPGGFYLLSTFLGDGRHIDDRRIR